MLGVVQAIVLAICNVSGSKLADSSNYPFCPILDYGMSVEEVYSFISSRSENIIRKQFSEDGVWLITLEKNQYYNAPFKVTYKFYIGKPFKTYGTTVKGLFAIELTFQDTNMTSDNRMDEKYIETYAKFFGIPIKHKNGHIVYSNKFDDTGNGYGISYLDGVWRLIVKNGNVISFNFPPRDRIRRGQLPTITYRQRFNIVWPEEEE